MKKLQYGILLVILPLVLAFSYYMTFSASKPLSIVKDINQVEVTTKLFPNHNSVVFKGSLFFINYVPETGYEIWRADETGSSNLFKEIIPGPESGSVKKAFADENYLYFIIESVGVDGTDAIYYLEHPTGEFKSLEFGKNFDKNKFKRLNNDWYGAVRDDQSNEESIVFFDGPNSSLITLDNQNISYSILDFTVFGGEIYYLINNYDFGYLELRKIANGNIETLYSVMNESFQKLYQTETAIYFTTKDANSNVLFHKYDGVSSSYIDKFSLVSEHSSTLGDRIIFYAKKDELSNFQIWKLDGASFEQLSNIPLEDSVTISRMTSTETGLYYLQKSQLDGLSVKYLENNLIQTVAFDFYSFDTFDMQTQRPLKVHNGSIYLKGLHFEEGAYKRAIWRLTNGMATRIISSKSYNKIEEPFSLNGSLYTFISIAGESQFFLLDQPNGSATVQLSVEANQLIYLAKDILSNTIYAYSNEPGQREIFAINDGVANKLLVNGATGSSRPRQFVGIKDKTYFIAYDSEYRRNSLWASDGYTVENVLVLSWADQNTTIENISKWGDKIIIVGRNKFELSYKVWTFDGENTTLLVESIDSITSEIISFEGSNAYFSAKISGNIESSLFHISSEGLSEIFNGQDVRRLNKTNNGIFFHTGTDSNAEIWRAVGSIVTKVSKDTVPVFEDFYSQFYSDNEYTYFRGCEAGTRLTVYGYTDSEGLKELDATEFDGRSCNSIKSYQLEGEVAFESGLELWRLNDGVFELVSNELSAFGGPKAHGKRLYFTATNSQSRATNLYVYESGQVNNTGLPGVWYSAWLSVSDENLDKDWLVYPGAPNSNQLNLYEYDGTNVTFIRTIDEKYRSIYSSLKLEELTLLQVWDDFPYASADLIVIDEAGELTYLNLAQEFNYGDIRYHDYPIAQGHGKWLFMQACHYTIGCEPFSMNINKLPRAKVSVSELTVHSGHTVFLDATHSEDPDGNITEYLWTVISGPEIEIIEGGSGEASFVAPMVDATTVVEIQLEIMDDGYDKDTITEQVTILPNTSPVAVLDAPSEVDSESVVKLDATQSSDPENDQLSYNWEIISDLDISLSDASGPESEFTVPSISEDTAVSVKLIVTDIVGNSAEDVVEIALKAADSGNPDDGSGNDDSNDSGSGGGGSVNLLLLFMLVSFILLRFGYYRR